MLDSLFSHDEQRNCATHEEKKVSRWDLKDTVVYPIRSMVHPRRMVHLHHHQAMQRQSILHQRLALMETTTPQRMEIISPHLKMDSHHRLSLLHQSTSSRRAVVHRTRAMRWRGLCGGRQPKRSTRHAYNEYENNLYVL